MRAVSHLTTVRRYENATADGLLGLILIDDLSGDAVALTAAQITRDADLVIHEEGLIGACSADNDRSWMHVNERPSWTMIEAVRVDHSVVLAEEPVQLDGGATTSGFGLCRDPHTLAGTTVFVHVGDTAPRSGQLRSVRGLFRMPVPDFHDPVIFYDALVVHSFDGEPLTVEGDAGAVVTDMNANAVGIVICGIGPVSYAAPIGSFLKGDESLRPATDNDVTLWNAEACLYNYPATVAPNPATAEPDPEYESRRNTRAKAGSDKDMADAGRELADECL